MKIKAIKDQISIFDYLETIKNENSIIETSGIKPKKIQSNSLVNRYKDSCTRIVKRVSGAIIVELEEKSIYFNKAGIKEFEMNKDTPLLPGDELLIVNQDKELNSIQLEQLKGFDVDSYIKRKGDSNIIIITDKTVVINPYGWILEYEMKPIYKDDEIIKINNIEVVEQQEEKQEFKVGDIVTAKYNEEDITGEVRWIYNNGETLNISWDNKQTAFYYKNVRKVAC